MIGAQAHRVQPSWVRSKLRGFSLVELIVVISVTSVLMAMLMPAMNQIRENAHRVICANNQRQIGQGLVIHHDDNRDQLPRSAALHEDESPRELMNARRAINWDNSHTHDGWDGLGILYSGHYCQAHQVFYCPSHHGNHPMERYADLWDQALGSIPIYTNFHYCGDMDWNTHAKRRLEDGNNLVLLTDGLRSAQDFNHDKGMNVLRGDGSVRWTDRVANIVDVLPLHESLPPGPDYQLLWNQVANDTD